MNRPHLSVVALMALLLASPAFATDPPFLPPAGAPDYVVTFAPPSQGDARVVYQSAGKTRIDLIGDKGTTSRYTSRDRTLTVTVVRDIDGRYRSVEMTRTPSPTPRWSETKEGDEFDELLGNRCKMWTTTEPQSPWMLSRSPIFQQRRLTKDGIELSTNYLLGGVRKATAVERRPLKPTEIEPPSDILDLGTWAGIGTENNNQSFRPSDFEVVLKPKTTTQGTPTEFSLTTRRHFPWTMHEMVGKYERAFLFENSDANTRIRYVKHGRIELQTHDREPFDTLMIERLPPNSEDELTYAAFLGVQAILGELCSWFDPFPGINHRTLRCRTGDGIVLAQTEINYGVRALEAVQVRRGPIDLANVAPPAEILSRAYWGLP